MQTGLIAFEIIAGINRIGIDLRSIIRKYGINDEEIELNELLRIMKDFEFKAKVKQESIDSCLLYTSDAADD